MGSSHALSCRVNSKIRYLRNSTYETNIFLQHCKHFRDFCPLCIITLDDVYVQKKTSFLTFCCLPTERIKWQKDDFCSSQSNVGGQFSQKNAIYRTSVIIQHMKHISEYIVNMLENYAQKIVAALDGLLSFFLLSWRFCTVFKNPRKCLIFTALNSK